MKKIKDYLSKEKIRKAVVDVLSDIVMVLLGIAVGYYIKLNLVGF